MEKASTKRMLFLCLVDNTELMLEVGNPEMMDGLNIKEYFCSLKNLI